MLLEGPNLLALRLISHSPSVSAKHIIRLKASIGLMFAARLAGINQLKLQLHQGLGVVSDVPRSALGILRNPFTSGLNASRAKNTSQQLINPEIAVIKNSLLE
jgi:hypothetical protein